MVSLIHSLKCKILFQHILQYLCKCLCKCLYKVSMFLFSYLHPCNIILFFLHFKVSHNHTKTHTLLLYCFVILIDLNRQVYLWVSVFISIANELSGKYFVVLWYQILFYFQQIRSVPNIVNCQNILTRIVWKFPFCSLNFQCWFKFLENKQLKN